MNHRHGYFGVCLLVVWMAVVSTVAAGAQEGQKLAERPLDHRQMIKPGDRVVFLGDQVTQQMTYTRAFATAMLAMRPGDNLRFFNGGYDGATVQDALTWADDLLAITQPQIVCLALGVNDLLPRPSTQEDQPPTPVPPLDQIRARFQPALAQLAQQIRLHPSVRHVILLGPSATQPGTGFRVDSATLNAQLLELSGWVREVAIQQKTAYIDMTEFSRVVYEEASKTQGEPLTFDGIRPNDLGGVVLASILLKGLGVETAELEPLAWAPIAPRKMARVRSALAVPLRVPKLEDADRSRALYELILEHDQLFFRAWRVAGKSLSAGNRQEMLARAENAWNKVLQTAQEFYAGRRR